MNGGLVAVAVLMVFVGAAALKWVIDPPAPRKPYDCGSEHFADAAALTWPEHDVLNRYCECRLCHDHELGELTDHAIRQEFWGLVEAQGRWP